MVSCAVLPPQLSQRRAPPGQLGPREFGRHGPATYDRSPPMNTARQSSHRKSVWRNLQLAFKSKSSAQPEVEVNNLPPFVMRQIPYDIWRKHYAKDKEGNYRGTHAPAEDCLLKPSDVQKWRLGDEITAADRWTRGSEVLPVYAEVSADEPVPEYQLDPPDVPPD
ncbi:hypothetical protein ABEF92_003742 [Exophiala dermatitidis]|uniref:Uncharacterized protein n=2 Tax=Exophiala dermatitidis TaxID=5970 RepID=H6C335_EXODN|nr:uncharacterized protein HMPREF1120_06068 [Exophiala dermatitidis NIH/UT8656]EHY58050.1 hypothetical protein HMPREF1120_06068 [Exophiala dermatitidis NIH/UT8656]